MSTARSPVNMTPLRPPWVSASWAYLSLCGNPARHRSDVGKWRGPAAPVPPLPLWNDLVSESIGHGGKRECLDDPRMTIEDFIIWLVISGVAGWLAGLIVKGYGLGLVGNIVVGSGGGICSGWRLPHIGFGVLCGLLS